MPGSSPVSAFQKYSQAHTEKKARKKKNKIKAVPDFLSIAKKRTQISGDDKPSIVVNTAESNGFPATKRKKPVVILSSPPPANTPVVKAVVNGLSNGTSPPASSTANGKKKRKNGDGKSNSPPAPSTANGKKKRKNGNVTQSHEAPARNEHHATEDAEEHDLEVVNESSVVRGKGLLAKLIAPMNVTEFFKDFWEKRPLLVKRHKPGYFASLGLSCETLDTMLRKNHLRYTKNVDITSYVNGKRETHNPPGRATPAEVWDYYGEGCSVRWLNPQTYASQLCMFCAALQEYLECFVGANVYLTPPNSQGFAPHYDDIEAFILQLEGRKHWKLYKSPLEKDVLPRSSSGNYKPDEIGEPFMEVTLDPGDLLYFPRGTIHQAVATDSHSLHVTLSAYQHNTWADLLEHLLPVALSEAIAANPTLRGGLPVGHLGYMGRVHADGQPTPDRAGFVKTAREMMAHVLAAADVDAAVDVMAKRFMQDALPPHLTAAEASCSMLEDGDRLLAGGKLVNSWSMEKDTLVKLTRAHCVRLIYEEGVPRLYYTLDNTRQYHEEEPGFFEITPEMVPCVQMLVQEYPSFIPVDMLPLDDFKRKVDLAGQLWLKGLLITHQPIGDVLEQTDG